MVFPHEIQSYPFTKATLTVQETKAMWVVWRQIWGDAVAEQSELRKITVHTSGVEGKLKSFGS